MPCLCKASLVHKQSFLNLLRQNDRPVTKVYLPEKTILIISRESRHAPTLTGCERAFQYFVLIRFVKFFLIGNLHSKRTHAGTLRKETRPKLIAGRKDSCVFLL